MAKAVTKKTESQESILTLSQTFKRYEKHTSKFIMSIIAVEAVEESVVAENNPR